MKKLSFKNLFCYILLVLLYSIYHNINTQEEDDTIDDYKYILQWEETIKSPFEFLEERDDAFIKNKCKFTNCYVTKNKNYFFNVTDFDAIIFNGYGIGNFTEKELPQERSSKQKYIFGAMESADRYPVCSKIFDGFFNWTWTYKLDSDFRWGYFAIYDLNRNVVGPKINMKWIEDMKPLNEQLKRKLSNKTKTAAWFVSRCHTKRRRENFVRSVIKELNTFGLSVDTYGKCGPHKCSKYHSKCFKLVEDNYFFYFAFENSFAEDYVTEKVVNALNNDAVPVVYGGANYSRFLPNGAYLDARKLGPNRLAYKMKEILINRTLFYEFFRWRNHYIYEQRDRNDVCNLCAMLNDNAKVLNITIWKDFRKWWNEKGACEI